MHLTFVHENSLNPGRVDPMSPAWEETRKPLAAAWQATTGERFYTVNVHFSSKRDSSSTHGDARPPVNGHSERRTQQMNVTAVSLTRHPISCDIPIITNFLHIYISTLSSPSLQRTSTRASSSPGT